MENKVVYDATGDEQMQERNHTEINRSESRRIESYSYKILVKDKDPLEGTLTREQMELIHNLYSNEGASLSQREVCRHLPGMILKDFKKILTAFSITKSSAPLAQHTIEENSTERLVELTIQNKENHYLKRLEQDRNRATEGLLKESLKKNELLKQELKNVIDHLGNIKLDITPATVRIPEYKTNKTMMVYLSDMHIGAEVSGYSIYNNTFNLEVAKKRFDYIIKELLIEAFNFGVSNIVVCNLGDSLDGYDAKTTRGGHGLPQNMNNKDQLKNYLELMIGFFKTLSECGQFVNISYVCVEGGNHDGDFGYAANKALEAYITLLNPNIDVEIFEKHINHFTIGKHTFVLTHGKDAKDMFKNMPLVLNDKWENQINEYLNHNNLTGTIHFIKADLHQSATTYAKRFTYKSVGSFFGSSEWIHKNFGNTKAVVDYAFINGEYIYDSRLILN